MKNDAIFLRDGKKAYIQARLATFPKEDSHNGYATAILKFYDVS